MLPHVESDGRFVVSSASSAWDETKFELDDWSEDSELKCIKVGSELDRDGFSSVSSVSSFFSSFKFYN